MKSLALLLSIIVLAMPAYAREDEITRYAQDCASSYELSAPFCECSLKTFSDMMRENSGREIKKLQKSYEAYTTIFLNDPAMTKEKIDAACDLHDQALEYNVRATMELLETEREAYDALITKKQEVFAKKKELVESYNATNQTELMLLKGNYCGDRNKINQINQDIGFGIEYGLYPEVTRLLEMNKMDAYSQIISMGQKAGCGK